MLLAASGRLAVCASPPATTSTLVDKKGTAHAICILEDILSIRMLTGRSRFQRDLDMQNKSTSENYCFREAGLLDIPYIFNMVITSSKEDKSFSARYLTPPGHVDLFILLFCALRSVRFVLRKKEIEQQLCVVEFQREPIGFLLCDHGLLKGSQAYTYIMKCVIEKSHRGKGHGHHIMKWLLENQTKRRPVIAAHCNPHAAAMKHILKKQHFIRKQAGRGIELYLLNMTGSEVHYGDIPIPPAIKFTPQLQ